jgi:DNA primase
MSIVPKEFIENLKSRIAISEVISKYVNLKAKSKGSFSGLCPFHSEKTPSFTVSDAKGFYHCFGCGVHGNAISFLMEHKGYSYVEAIKELANIAGMQIPIADAKTEQKYHEKQKIINSSLELMELATKYYERNLKSSSGTIARDYLQNRGLTAETIDKFRIGFATDEWEGLRNYLQKQGASDDIMLANGLITEKEDGGKKYDRFRNRIIFPIFDSQNRVIAYGGRILNEDKTQAKYLNSSETELFKKGYVLYGYNFARDNAYKKSQAIVVEGYMDVITMHQAGFDNCVAPLGTAVTENHIFQLWKMTKEPIFCMDGDEAGIRASKRVAEEFMKYLKAGYSIKFCFLNDAKDPDEFIKKNGFNAMNKALENSTPLSEALWNFNFNEVELKTPEKKAEFSKKMQELANTIEDNDVKTFYKEDFKNRLSKAFSNVINFNKYQNKNYNNLQNNLPASLELKQKATLKTSALDADKERLLVLICFFPSLLRLSEVEEFLYNFSSHNKKLENLSKIIIENSQNSYLEGDFDNLISQISDNLKNSYSNIGIDSPYKDELVKNIKTFNDSVTAWQYMFSEYQLKNLKAELNKLLEEKNSDINLLMSVKNKIIEFDYLNKSYSQKYESLKNE